MSLVNGTGLAKTSSKDKEKRIKRVAFMVVSADEDLDYSFGLFVGIIVG